MEKTQKCPHCVQYIIDNLVEVDYLSVEKKNCTFCGKKIFVEAKICKYCKRWLDELDRAVNDLDSIE